MDGYFTDSDELDGGIPITTTVLKLGVEPAKDDADAKGHEGALVPVATPDIDEGTTDTEGSSGDADERILITAPGLDFDGGAAQVHGMSHVLSATLDEDKEAVGTPGSFGNDDADVLGAAAERELEVGSPKGYGMLHVPAAALDAGNATIDAYGSLNDAYMQDGRDYDSYEGVWWKFANLVSKPGHEPPKEAGLSFPARERPRENEKSVDTHGSSNHTDVEDGLGVISPALSMMEVGRSTARATCTYITRLCPGNSVGGNLRSRGPAGRTGRSSIRMRRRLVKCCYRLVCLSVKERTAERLIESTHQSLPKALPSRANSGLCLLIHKGHLITGI